MTPETRDHLMRHYDYAKGALKKLGPLTRAERAACKAEGYPAGMMTTLTHDDSVGRLIGAADAVTPQDVTSAFIAGIGGSWIRGRQPLISYAHARHIKPHAADRPSGYSSCNSCGFSRKARVDFSEEALRVRLGFSWNECPENYLVDLEDFARFARPAPTQSDRATLQEVLATAASAAADCTPGQLEKTLASRKLIPASDKYARYGILSALAIVGVLPNELLASSWDRMVTETEARDASRRARGGHRSDITVPLAGWRGALGVDWKRAKALFGISRPRA